MACGLPFIENERKFLVSSDEWRSQVCRTAHIRQSYFPCVAGGTARVRRVDDESWLTYKTLKMGISRGEVEIRIFDAYAEWLFAICELPALEKTRHHVVSRGALWHVDVFLGRHHGLVVAEIELDHPAEAFSVPNWIGDEVTHDRRFSNSNLYREGRRLGFVANRSAAGFMG